MLRLFALTLTGTLVVAAASVSMDLLAWQCAVPGSRCVEHNAMAEVLSRLWTPGARLAVGALAPASLVALLWVLGNKTWRDYESQPMKRAATQRPVPGSAGDGTLADRRFWEGQVPVQRLRAVHITGAWALLTLLVAEPTRRHLRADGTGWALLPEVVFGAALALVVVCAGAVLVPRIADRRATTDEPTARAQQLEPVWRWLPRGAAALLGLCAVIAALPWAEWTQPWRTTGTLPLVNGFLLGGFVVQVVMLVVLVVLTWRIPQDRNPLAPIAVGGQALAMLTSIGWLLAGGFAAGGALRVAQWLGHPVADRTSHEAQLARTLPPESGSLVDQMAALAEPQPLYVPPMYTWVALVAAVLAIAVVPVLGATVYRRLRRLDRERAAEIGQLDDGRRRRAIGRIQDVADLSDAAPRYLGWLVLAVNALVLAAAICYALDPTWPQRNVQALTDLGSWAMGVVALLLVALGRAAYRTPQLRRTVGIVWDLASFWPRATHPLAPPCYTERVLPDLVHRAGALTARRSDRLLLSAHSQGSVIALAAVLQLPEDTARRTCLLTYGSPLTRLYAAFFPGYVNSDAYEAAAARLGCATDSPAQWPWRNLYRLTDPIGSWVLAPSGTDPGPDVFDHELVDPVFERPAGDRVWPPARGHSDYWADPRFEDLTAQVLRIRG